MSEKIEVILLDVGNSSVKSSLVINNEIVSPQTFSSLSEVDKQYPEIPFVVSSVRKLPEEMKNRRNTIFLSHKTDLPIELDYETPETLGADRIAAAVGAFDLFPERNNLIIDLGTCVTIDLVDSEGVYRGGVIAPGLKMRMKAMSAYTDQLPDISSEWYNIKERIMGKTTKECMLNGSYQSIIHEINGVLKTLEKNFTSLNMILSGGDADFFESKLKAHIFAGSKIVQRGLYRIWKHHQ